MNHVLMGFLVAGTALGGSALKNVESHTTPLNGSNLAPGYLYKHNLTATLTCQQRRR